MVNHPNLIGGGRWAANDNVAGRRVVVQLFPPVRPTIVETEVFGALLAELEAINDNQKETYYEQ